MAKILIADSDPRGLADVAKLLEQAGHEVLTATSDVAAQELLDSHDPGLLLADIDLPKQGGLRLLAAARQHDPDLGVILLTAFGSVEDAVEAMHAGASDFLRKPFSNEQLQVAIDQALQRRNLLQENEHLRSALDDRVRVDNLIGDDPRMQAIFKTVKAVADTRTTALITGESGSGKTIVARALHAMSSRRNGPFIEVNCGALPETLLESELFGHVRGAFTGAHRAKPGKFEAAHGGTIFLDEIGTSSAAFQVKLLRVLQDRVIERIGDHRVVEVDVRILLATNLDLEEAVREGRFREDLYYRINVVAIEMPPLRHRPADIVPLARHFLTRFAAEHAKSIKDFDEEALQILQQARWPGNVRQLENVIERAVVFGQTTSIGTTDLPATLVREPQTTPVTAINAVSSDGVPTPLKEALGAAEKRILERALHHCDGNRERTARVLGINRSTLFAKLRRHGVR